MRRLIVTALLSLTVIAASTFVVHHSGYILPGTVINGRKTSFEHYSNVYDNLYKNEITSLTLIANDESVVIPRRTMAAPTDFNVSFLDWLFRKNIDVNFSTYIDDVDVKRFVSSIYKPVTNASIVCDSEGFWKLIPEDTGSQFDVEKAVNLVKSCTDNTLDISDLCIKPEVTSDTLVSDYNNVSWINDICIEYNGLTVDKSLLNKYVVNCQLLLTVDDCEEWIAGISDRYDTRDSSYTFVNSLGTEVTVPYKTFGNYVNISKEAEALFTRISEHESGEFSPVLSGYDNLENTYVEISIDTQHLWYYKDGELTMETDIVTGRKGQHDTPTGVYYITECIPGKYLIDDTYKTWVNRWMRLTNSGIGLHDASWRSSFGKNIYTYNGSHGCINLPKNWAYEFYKDAYVGMPVIIY